MFVNCKADFNQLLPISQTGFIFLQALLLPILFFAITGAGFINASFEKN
jgi:hypothetical protein